MYPERFAWVLRVNRNDPEVATIIRMVKQSPHGKAIRIIPGMNPMNVKAFADGEYNPVLKAVSENGLPLFLYLPDQPELIAACAEKFPDLKIIVDHCGLYNNAMRQGLSNSGTFTEEQQIQMFNKVLQLSKYSNVILKWAHYSTMFNIPAFPGEGLRPILRKAIEHFGAERIIWASDFSVNQIGENWGELLYSVKNNLTLSDSEMSSILGGNARRLLNWN
jgi:predicted TIM-barrel fold metal-dependent hydrolase